MAGRPRVGRSGYAAGLQCERRLWLSVHAPERATDDAAPLEQVLSAGRELRVRARSLVPGGEAVDEADFERALERTRQRLADASVPALFGAAFEHGGLRVRVDVLERLGGDAFGLREVRSATSVRDEHLDGAAAALYAVCGSGLRVSSVEIWHVNGAYVRTAESIDWSDYFARCDVTADAEFLAGDVSEQVDRFARVLESPAAPDVEPSPHCRRPWPCEFSSYCRRGKPKDWIGWLPALRAAGFHALREQGVERIGEIPDEFELAARDARAREAWRGDGLALAPGLAAELAALGPPTDYLDFEAIAPALPRWLGTSPYQMIPFQWSLHRLDADGGLTHREFLNSRGDPRRPFAESLLEALRDGDRPLLVYSSFEARALDELALALPDLASELAALRERLRDLYPVLRGGLYHTDFRGSFSLKRVAPALDSAFGYADLEAVADGGAAAAAYERIAAGEASADQEAALRRALLDYCRRDTEALVSLHRSLRARLEAAGRHGARC